MDIRKILQLLHKERTGLDQLIASLEALEKANSKKAQKPLPKRRGRKSMNESERREVSRRMKQYWAARRAVKFGP